MIDIYVIPLYYISFSRNKNLEGILESAGFKNINHHQSIDARTYNPQKLLEDGLISVKAYEDLINGRSNSESFPSIGAFGCAFSHYTLWKKCIDNNIPYIIISEDDIYFTNKINKSTENNIINILTQPTGGIFTCKKINKNSRYCGTQFYFINKEACRKLIKYIFPMEVQVDWYISSFILRDDIKYSGIDITRQTLHKSKTQNFCVKCWLPRHWVFYFFILWLILASIFWIIFFIVKYLRCKKRCF